MDVGTFRAWLSGMDDLTAEQREEVQEIWTGGNRRGGDVGDRGSPHGRAVLLHCGTGSGVKRGAPTGLRRYRCIACGKSFNALTGTPLARLRHKERWLDFAQSLKEGDTVGIGRALRRRRRHGVSVASPLPAGARDRDCTAARHRRSRRNLPSGQSQGRSTARSSAPQAWRQGGQARPVARTGANPGGRLTQRHHAQRGVAGGVCQSHPGGAGARYRQGCSARHRRRRCLSAVRRRHRHQP